LFEVLLNEASDGYFQFRRDLSITMPMVDAIVHAKASVSILAPEIVLLYLNFAHIKAKPRFSFRC
jgi:hypothetical protein